ncbi:2'-5' RNA ligase family protein [Salinimicrobium xinjiangense]|uniref:2'-5' RNA ligase family protein n=1 Tax=Salinimicrobium xinjiangense TaxID=438596 RepID=UPI0004060068|nr:2'-5' RNA ligase family protein [Salinimicrobium xinjiangense]
MANSKALYFLALVPPNEVKEEIRQIKLEIKEKYDASHALKLPAHITIIPPFRLEKQQEGDIFKKLKLISSFQAGFTVKLKNFGHFGQRVIFIEVENPQPVMDIYTKAKTYLPSCFSNPEDSSLHPHITLATRDLKKDKFKEAWQEFKTRTYSGSFEAISLLLFKHNGKSWDIYKEFSFNL